MNREVLTDLLESIRRGETSVKDGLERLVHLPFDDLGFARIDSHRSLRRGFPEAIFCQGKTSDQAALIVERMVERGSEVLATRASKETYEEVAKKVPQAVYFPRSRVITVEDPNRPEGKGNVAVVSAGTSDIPVAEEAAITARLLGAKVSELYDVGVAGLHRVLHSARELREANVLSPASSAGWSKFPWWRSRRASVTGPVFRASPPFWGCSIRAAPESWWSISIMDSAPVMPPA
jgi:NCAIR mutase (PurE)-related protein